MEASLCFNLIHETVSRRVSYGAMKKMSACIVFFSKVPAFLNVVDIAGLVKGAHKGQGLGNAFLSHISACDGIFHMTRKLSLLHLLCRDS